MAFENLTSRIQTAMKTLSGKGKVSETDLDETLREIRLALLEADVNLKTARNFIKQVRDKALGAKVLEGLNPSEQVVKIVNDQLTAMMGEKAVPLNKSSKIPTVIMMAGLQGAGKTTTVAKLANRLKDENHARPLLIAADVYRPAAIEQLKSLGDQLSIPVFDEGVGENPRKIVEDGLKQARENKNDYVFIDTAGRLQIDQVLMQELKDIEKMAEPDEILLTVDAMTGQNATETARGFNDALGITGVVLTKLDGDTRGGAALSIREVTGKPIKFVGEGEKVTDLDVFYPDRMASRILGMGDVLSLIEKTQKDFDEKQASEELQKLQENTFDFNDFLEQLKQIQNMGPMEDMLKMIPGMANNPAMAQAQIGPKDFSHMEAIVYSMTPGERVDPELLTPARRRRIAAGSGRPVVDVNRLIKQFKQMRQMMYKFTNGKGGLPAGMEDMLGGMDPSAMGVDPSQLGDLNAGGFPGLGGSGKGSLGGKVADFAMKRAFKKIKKAKKKRNKRHK
ncbi:signal recognition particle protein [Oenococcus oeni]|uniref:signal recognition particle protein n=1 Tax=Oenococcus oeni TaxID=1247 RepID=UPI0008F927C5|nr:signal recognition particle protein [Oenococcus oeni]OIK57604.1 signal recognition particle protein [Oenococcus oeni]OIK88127.1 signal recognition particle protein [Oenococcus oeni]OIL10197.1 signal recognition particle protein [Oenococcus oeni]OIL15697.1 signal recognition particle protein [Oenococcus oeni]OIM26060.1 signal recognition particle protein [Oenococcus oeni]